MLFCTLNSPISVTSALSATGSFEFLSLEVEEAEHSLEMHLPYIAKIMEDKSDFSIVPIMVGSLSKDSEEHYGNRFSMHTSKGCRIYDSKQTGKLLAPYLGQEGTVFVVSSDFCHWGKRFDYTYYNKEDGPIHSSIEALDRR